jgi:hypothetical protein
MQLWIASVHGLVLDMLQRVGIDSAAGRRACS